MMYDYLRDAVLNHRNNASRLLISQVKIGHSSRHITGNRSVNSVCVVLAIELIRSAGLVMWEEVHV